MARQVSYTTPGVYSAISNAARGAEVGRGLALNQLGQARDLELMEGLRNRYPWRPFWELAGECGTPVILNSDAHDPADVARNLDDAMTLARECGLRVVGIVTQRGERV